MLKTWTDTHYKLDSRDWLYIAKHNEDGSVSLVCPGYARDGAGFSIHFNTAHLEILEQLVEVLRTLPSQPALASESLEQRDQRSVWGAIPPSEQSEIQSAKFQSASINQPLISYPVGKEK